MRSFSLAVFVCSTLAGIVSATADDSCQPLSIVTSVALKIGADNRAYVPVKINGVAKSMLVDTGGFFTEMTQPVADELKLSPRHTRLVLVGVAGDSTRLAVRAGFTLGNLHADSMDFMVMPGVHKFAPDVPDVAGLLAPNLLDAYDVDFDFGGHKFNLISQKHCDGKVVYWPAGKVAVVPVRVNQDGHIMVPVELEGRRLTAMLDTGSSRSLLNLGPAQSNFGIVADSDQTPFEGHIGDTGASTYLHRFKSLSLEGIAISNPTLMLIPDLMHNRLKPHDTLEGNSRIGNPGQETGLSEMILGMDILRHLHLYVAYGEQKLYITPAAPTPAPSPPPAKAPAQSK
ncbi:MAG TPA: retropepsin-like aspartic protease [Rhizomicrobium sp.]|nr:retropepsin-like aspartic protease [Rhizomicrobium sp.]